MKTSQLLALLPALLMGARALASPLSQPATLEIVAPPTRTMTFGLDRTASTDFKDIGRKYKNPSIYFADPVGDFGATGLFAGGKLRLRALSYQMWLLENPQAKTRREIPKVTDESAARFTVTFLNKGAFHSSVVADTTKEIDDQEEDMCIPCSGSINPAHFVLEAPAVDIPSDATGMQITLSHTINRTTGTPTSVQVATVPFAFSNVFSLRGITSVRPRDESRPQFQIMAGGQPAVGAEFRFDEKHPMDARWFSLVHHDPAVHDAYEQLLKEKYDPSRTRVKSIGLFWRTDPALAWERLAAGSYAIPAVNGKRLEFVFVYSFSAVQNGSEVKLGIFYDSPTGDMSRGWIINLEP